MLYLISREAKIFAGVCLTIPADCFACFYVKNPWAISFVIEVKWHNPKTATTTLNDQYMGMSAMVLKQWWDMVFKFVSFQSTPSWYLGIPIVGWWSNSGPSLWLKIPLSRHSKTVSLSRFHKVEILQYSGIKTFIGFKGMRMPPTISFNFLFWRPLHVRDKSPRLF